MTRAITVRLDADDYDRLESAAREIGVLPGTFARMLIRSSLSESSERPDVRLSAALQRAAELRRRLAGHQVDDAVALVRQGREELDRRGLF